jgi:signal transduction histidine kinase
VIKVLQPRVLATEWRHRARVAWRGLIEVLAGNDPAPSPRTARQRRMVTASAVLGAMLLAFALVVVAFALYRIAAPGFAVLRISRTVKGSSGVVTKAGFQSPKQLFTTITNLGSVQILLGSGSLLLAVRNSLPVWRFVFVVTLLGPLVQRLSWGPLLTLRQGSESWQLVVLVVIFCIVGLRHSRSTLWWMSAFMMVPIWLWVGSSWERPATATAMLVAVTVALDALGASQRARRALVAQSEVTELEEARRAVLEERTRIARELHDVVAHHMSLIAVQAETAPYRLGDLPASALAEFSSVSSQAREALTDMRRLLGVLRSDDQVERAPQPQLEDVPELVAVTRRVGVNVDLSMPEGERPVPAGVGLCAYRIVQEALSNACRHAPGSLVSVTVDDDHESLRLRVANGPCTAPALPPGSRRAGHGLAGMRERVAMLGGSLSAGPAPDGGYAVSAVLPLTPSLTH